MPTMKLRDLLKETFEGGLVLPEFQRDFVWSPEDVRELLVSIFGGYFIGSLLFLEAHREEAPFAIRLIKGVEKVNPEVRIQHSIKIVLDGQQRTTAVFYAFYAPDIPVNNRLKYPHRFFVDIKKAIENLEKEETQDDSPPDWENTIVAVSVADKRRFAEIKRNEYFVPLNEFKDLGALVKKFNGDPNVPIEKLVDVHNRVMEYEIHVITLPRATSLDKIVETFERLNKTGMPLSTFDLATARLYKYGINLRELLKRTKEKYKFARVVRPETILKVIALLGDKEPRRKNLLEIDYSNFYEKWERASKALEAAYRRMLDVKNGYGVLDFKKWAPYSTLIVPLAAMIDYLRTNNKESPGNYAKIDAFYWATIFMNRYDQAVDSQSFSDFKDFVSWVEEGTVPEFIEKFDPESVDLDVSSTTSAIFRGVISLIVLKGTLDFKTGQPPQFELHRSKIQIDHIFPRSIYNEDRVLNRTLITTNQSKSNKKPSEYFKERIHELGEDKVKEILSTHLIPPEALDALLNDELERFMELRKRAIIEEIKRRVVVGA